MEPATPSRVPKRPFNLLLNEATVQQARQFTDNLSATVDALLADYVARQNDALRSRQQRSDAIAEAWNRLCACLGSLSPELSSLH